MLKNIVTEGSQWGPCSEDAILITGEEYLMTSGTEAQRFSPHMVLHRCPPENAVECLVALPREWLSPSVVRQLDNGHGCCGERLLLSIVVAPFERQGTCEALQLHRLAQLQGHQGGS